MSTTVWGHLEYLPREIFIYTKDFKSRLVTSNIRVTHRAAKNVITRKYVTMNKDELFTWVSVSGENNFICLYSLNHCVSLVFSGFHWIVIINPLWQRESEILTLVWPQKLFLARQQDSSSTKINEPNEHYAAFLLNVVVKINKLTETINFCRNQISYKIIYNTQSNI